MTFVGLPLATLLQIGAVAGAIVVVFYILKLRRRPIAVPFSKIWERILRDKEATSLFSQLKRLLSLLLQLALLALMIMALGDPRTAVNLIESRNIVVLVDASASMKAGKVDHRTILKRPPTAAPPRCARGAAPRRSNRRGGSTGTNICTRPWSG